MEFIHIQGTEDLFTLQTKCECIKFDTIGITSLCRREIVENQDSGLSLQIRKQEKNILF